MVSMFVTLLVSQALMSWLNAWALTNIECMVVTLLVSQLPMSWLKKQAPENVKYNFLTRPVSHLLTSPLNRAEGEYSTLSLTSACTLARWAEGLTTAATLLAHAMQREGRASLFLPSEFVEGLFTGSVASTPSTAVLRNTWTIGLSPQETPSMPRSLTTRI